MKALLPFLIIFHLTSICNSISAQQYIWTQKVDYGGGMVYDPFSFVINNKAYVGSGVEIGGVFNNDVWQYDPSLNIWTQMADLPGPGIYGARGFSVNGFGYVGTGKHSTFTDAFYRYNPITNSWNQMADFAGSGRYTSVSFTVGGSGYIGLGYDPCKDDFWRYNAANDTWTQAATFPGAGRQAAVSFVINDIAYVGSGLCPGTLYDDFYKYDHLLNAWSPAASFPGTARNAAFSFSINNKGYFGLGFDYLGLSQPFNVLSDFWEYDPVSDSWLQLPDFPGTHRYEGISFAINNKGYIGLGADTTFNVNFLSDFWEYAPDATGISENNITSLVIYPNPSAGLIHVTAEQPGNNFTIHDLRGKRVLDQMLSNGMQEIDVSHLAKGNYHCRLWVENRVISKGSFVKL